MWINKAKICLNLLSLVCQFYSQGYSKQHCGAAASAFPQAPSKNSAFGQKELSCWGRHFSSPQLTFLVLFLVKTVYNTNQHTHRAYSGILLYILLYSCRVTITFWRLLEAMSWLMPVGGSAVLWDKPVAICLRWYVPSGHDASYMSRCKPVPGKTIELLSGIWTVGHKPCLQGLRVWLFPKQHGV